MVSGRYIITIGIIVAGLTLSLLPDFSRAEDKTSLSQDWSQVVPHGLDEDVLRNQLTPRQAAEKTRRDIYQLFSDKDAFAKDGLILGNRNGDITIVEFADYNCPYCQRGHNELIDIINQDDNIRLLYREFPILGPLSEFASKAALASARQGRYADFNKALMQRGGRLDEEAVRDIALSIGINWDQIVNQMDTPAVYQSLQRSLFLAHYLDIHQTPNFFINGTHVPGYIPPKDMRTLIASIRKQKAGNH